MVRPGMPKTTRRSNFMSSAEANFGEIEFGVNRALAYAILARETPHGYLTLYRLSKAFVELEKVVPLLTPEYLESLSDGQRRRLRLRMQDTHFLLARFLRSNEAGRFRRFFIVQSFLDRLQKGTDHLAVVLEDLSFA
jgi:hypothetical protein